MGKAHANHVPVFLSAALVKPQPVAPDFDRTAKQEPPLRTWGNSRESLRRGCSCHKFGSSLAANCDATSQRHQNGVTLLQCATKPVKFLNTLGVIVIRHPRPP